MDYNPLINYYDASLIDQYFRYNDNTRRYPFLYVTIRSQSWSIIWDLRRHPSRLST